MGQIECITDALGQKEHYEYNARGELDLERGAVDKMLEPLVVEGMGKIEECIA